MTPWGVRFDAAYNQLHGSTIGTVEIDEASIWSAMADATLDFPWGQEPRSGFYLLGGVGLHTFSGWDIDDEDFEELIVGGIIVDETEVVNESTTDFGVNAGAGLRFALGGANRFVEARWVNIFTEGRDTRYFPVTLGITSYSPHECGGLPSGRTVASRWHGRCMSML